MFEVPYGQNPYSAIGRYIRENITVIEDIIAVIKINEVETNQLFTVDINEENYFIWENDWWEGEENVTLIDFFSVSEAQRANQNVQSADTISRQEAIDALMNHEPTGTLAIINVIDKDVARAIIEDLPSAQPESDCVLKEFGNCSYSETGCSDCKVKAKIRNALSAQPNLQPTCNNRATDTISRRAAIEALEAKKDKSAKGDMGCFYNTIIQNDIDALKDLPSARPELIRCKDCKYSKHWYWDKRRCFLWAEDGICVLEDGFCNYAERRQDD